jgi:DNA-binding LacI/PurR family transcriptional regulator
VAGTRATLKDVAARAGVSISTASRVVHGDRSRPVEAGTEERIRAAVRELRYRPNLAARSRARGEVGSGSHAREVGVVLGTTSYKFSDPFFSRVIEGIDVEILANRLHLRFVYSVADLAAARPLCRVTPHRTPAASRRARRAHYRSNPARGPRVVWGRPGSRWRMVGA